MWPGVGTPHARVRNVNAAYLLFPISVMACYARGMTASKRQRAGDIDGTLRAMVEIVGNWRLDDALFERDDARFEGTFPTTWEHLVATDCLQQKSNWHYRLTPGGWIKGLEAAGRLRDEKTNGALGSLCASIKRRCEDGGLRHRTGVTIQELSEETDIPQGRLRDEKTNGALGSLCASIKRRCEDGGLRHRTGVTIQELSEETDIPQG